MRAVDAAIVARLEAAGITVYPSYVEVNNETKVVTYPMPFVVYYSSIGIDEAPRLSGRNFQRTTGFMVTYVGLTAEQAKWEGEKARAALVGRRLDVNGRKSGLIECQTSPWVWRDDDMIRPDGQPVFYGRDTYEVPIAHLPTLEGA